MIVIGGSAGGLEALVRIVKDLPPDLPAAVFVVIHCSPDHPSFLPEVLSRNGQLPAAYAVDGEDVGPGRIYVARPGYHLAVAGGRVRAWFGPKVNMFRPAIDPLFRSAAEHHGPRVIGVVLSGGMTDGVAGLLAIKRDGGVAVVQYPSDAPYPNLPRSALAAVGAEHAIPFAEIGGLLRELVAGPVDAGAGTMLDTITKAEESSRRDLEAQARGERAGQVSLFSCPHCGGVLRQTEESRLAEFLCHIGHAYEGEALLVAQGETIETTSWNLMRALKERVVLARELAALARRRGDAAAESRLAGLATNAERQLAFVEGELLNGPQA
jgi:two-component system chemotaxis response regulator CheB